MWNQLFPVRTFLYILYPHTSPRRSYSGSGTIQSSWFVNVIFISLWPQQLCQKTYDSLVLKIYGLASSKPSNLTLLRKCYKRNVWHITYPDTANAVSLVLNLRHIGQTLGSFGTPSRGTFWKYASNVFYSEVGVPNTENDCNSNRIKSHAIVMKDGNTTSWHNIHGP